MRMSIYINDYDYQIIKSLKQYAKKQKWSVSRAIIEIISDRLVLTDSIYKTEQVINEEKFEARKEIAERWVKETYPEESKKLDPDAFFAQIEARVMPKETNDDIDKQVADCVKEHTNNNGEVSCYHFDNARDYRPFCKQFCWTSELYWGKRVRK